MFAKRGNLGGELRTAFKMFDDQFETFSRVIQSHGYALENNLESIRCVYQLIQSLGSWPTDRIDDEKIIDEALKSMKKLDSRLKQLSTYNHSHSSTNKKHCQRKY